MEQFHNTMTVSQEMTVTIRLSWWFKWLYIPCLFWFCRLTGQMPNKDKMSYWLKKAITIK